MKITLNENEEIVKTVKEGLKRTGGYCPCRIYLLSEDPDGLKGINQEKMAKADQARYRVIKPYRDQIENK